MTDKIYTMQILCIKRTCIVSVCALKCAYVHICRCACMYVCECACVHECMFVYPSIWTNGVTNASGTLVW